MRHLPAEDRFMRYGRLSGRGKFIFGSIDRYWRDQSISVKIVYLARSTRVVILIKNKYTLWGRKRFVLPVTYCPTNLVYPFTLRVTGIIKSANFKEKFYDRKFFTVAELHFTHNWNWKYIWEIFKLNSSTEICTLIVSSVQLWAKETGILSGTNKGMVIHIFNSVASD